MKKTLAVIISAIFLFMTCWTFAEDATATEGIAMPSIGEILHRYPDSEEADEAGQVTESYGEVTEEDFEEFGKLLIRAGAILQDSTFEGSILNATVLLGEGQFFVQYDSQAMNVSVSYPIGTYDEMTQKAKEQTEKMAALIKEGKIDEVTAVYEEIPDKEQYLPATSMMASTQTYKDGVIPTGKPWIGITVAFAGRDQWKDERIPVGAYITGVTENSPADKAGLQPGDILVEFNGVEIKKQDDTKEALGGLLIGQKVVMRVWRSNKVTDVENYKISAKGEYLDTMEMTIEARE